MNMNNRLRMQLMAATTIITCFSCILPLFETTVLIGEASCHPVLLPKVWHYQTAENKLTAFTMYRRISEPEPAVCIAKKTQFIEEISEEKICFNKANPGFFISDEQWEAGEELDPQYWDSRPEARSSALWQGLKERSFEYGGKRFPRAGKYWVAMTMNSIIPSPSGKYVVLQSVDNDNTKDFPPGRDHGREPGNTSVYIQVYELATAKEVVRIRVRLRHISAGTVHEATRWLDGDQLLINSARAGEFHSCYLEQ